MRVWKCTPNAFPILSCPLIPGLGKQVHSPQFFHHSYLREDTTEIRPTPGTEPAITFIKFPSLKNWEEWAFVFYDIIPSHYIIAVKKKKKKMEPNLHLWSPSSWTQRLFDAMKHTATESAPSSACMQPVPVINSTMLPRWAILKNANLS